MSAPYPSARNIYRAALVSFGDGDTCHLRIELIGGVERVGRCRFASINAPEINTPEGKVAAAWTANWFTAASLSALWPLLVQCLNVDNYGRPIVTIWRVSDKACLNDDIIAAGQAVPYKIALGEFL